MTYEKFKLIHSELIMSVQYIEQDLRIIYALVKDGEYCKNLDDVEECSLGMILWGVKEADEANDAFKMSDADYELIDNIRELRNYWCHQCYLDFHYIEDPEEHEIAFQTVARRLHGDETRVYELQQKVEKLRIATEKKFADKICTAEKHSSVTASGTKTSR